ncbi:MAG: dihydrofolate reductase [Ignavibacteriaceae bacterium]|nr:dihydrofolate reductase [Bacteroidota bacterium]
MRIIIIVAVAANGVIGRANGEMPWHVKEDFQHFKKTTMSSPIIMGRKSFVSLGKPLKGRENIVVTRNTNLNYDFDDVTIVLSLNEAIEHCKLLNKEKIFITGGGEIYKQSISIADEMIISHMKFDAVGEVKFPEIDMNEWYIDSKDDREKFEIVTYKRKS